MCRLKLVIHGIHPNHAQSTPSLLEQLHDLVASLLPRHLEVLRLVIVHVVHLVLLLKLIYSRRLCKVQTGLQAR